MFNQLLNQLQTRNINWIGIARSAGFTRAIFSKHFGGHQAIAKKNYVRIFHAIIEITGALVFNGRIWIKDEAGIILWISADDWNDQNKRGLMDAHDLYLYLAE